MLQQIRDKITGWFASLFLGAIAVVFIFWGIRFESSATMAAAKVNGEKIPVEQVRRAWQDRQTELQQAMRDELPPALVKPEQKKLLNDFVRREVLLQHADKLGYRVSDQDSCGSSSRSRRCRSMASSRATAMRRCSSSRAAAKRDSSTISARISRSTSCRTASASRRSRRRARSAAASSSKARPATSRYVTMPVREVRGRGDGQRGRCDRLLREEQGEVHDAGDGVAAVRAAEARRRGRGRAGDRAGRSSSTTSRWLRSDSWIPSAVAPGTS